MNFQIGDEIHFSVKGVTNDRVYRSSAEIVEIIPPHFAKVKYRQPWAKPHNCMRPGVADLRTAKKIHRRIKP